MAHENDGHRARLRKRMMQEGLENFQDHEVLELLLFQFLPYKDTNKIAHTLLNEFGGFCGVLDASPQQLMTVSGISEVTACNIAVLKEVFARYRRSDAEKVKFTSIDAIAQYAKTLVGNARCEKLIVAYFDHATSFKHSEEYSSGKLDRVHVDVKQIVVTAMRVNAAGVALFHSHVDGVCEPSEADVDFTKQLLVALAAIDVALIEHIIFNGTQDYFSFYKSGLLNDIASKYKANF